MPEDTVSIEDIAKEFEKIKKSLQIPQKKAEIVSLIGQTSDPSLWSDPENAKKVTQELSDTKKLVDEVEKLDKEIASLLALKEEEGLGEEVAKEAGKIKKALATLKLATYLSGKYDKKNAIVSIHAGQGGTEAMDWVSMLFRMYLRFAEKRNWKTDILDETKGEEAGTKSVVFRVQGPHAYGYLKHESGTHRLVRQSPFNADNLRQTSFALLEVVPEFEEGDNPEVEIKESDLEWDFFRSSGHGGQNVNKVSTAVRLTHTPTGIVVSSQQERSQEKNRQIALNLLKAKLWAKKEEEEKTEEKKIKGDYTPATWGTQIRSYVLHPYKMVKDLRTEVETANAEAVLDGDIDKFIEAELREL